MTPSARVAAAIEVLDLVIAGTAAERALTTWARQHRFAGSKDRAAIRDHVFEVLRCWRSFAARGGAETGRGLMIGAFHGDPDLRAAMFSGQGYGPPGIEPGEVPEDLMDLPQAIELDCPDWLMPPLQASLGASFAPVMQLLQTRAPVFLRVNSARTTPDAARAALAAEGIETHPHILSKNALEVSEGARKIKLSESYLNGLVELQDAASQAIMDELPLTGGMTVLDYCAGGGGKALAMASHPGVQVYVHDVAPERMRDIPARADRAGVSLTQIETDQLADQGTFDLVLCDAPCSGSGAWRRSPEGKWALTQDRLKELREIQRQILHTTAPLVANSGTLAYATCSMLGEENTQQVEAFTRKNPDWTVKSQRQLTPMDGGDGFFVSLFGRESD